MLTIGYDIENLKEPARRMNYQGAVTTDHYGRAVPKAAHGTENLGRHTSSSKLILSAVSALFDRIMDKDLLARRVTITANHVIPEASLPNRKPFEQLDLFTDYEALQAQRAEEEAALEREKRMQKAILKIKKDHGKNAILKGMNLEKGGMTMERNKQINKRFKDVLVQMNDPEIKIEDVVFHSIRHTSTGLKLKLSGGDLKAVQGDGGWNTPDMVTKRYAHILDEDRRNLATEVEEKF